MRDHEVPTHVGAEDKALLFLTFPQVAAMLAVAGMGYGVWRFTPFGPSELRLGLAAVVALIGVAATIGQIGGRRLPLVAADLLKYRLTPRRYEGAVLELVRAAPPAPVERPPSRLTLLASAARRKTMRRKQSNNNIKENKEKRKMKSERRAFRPHMWFGKRRRHAVEGRKAGKGRHAILGVAMLAVLAAGLVFAQSTSADGPDEEEEWHWLSEVEFRPPEPVLGRRLFVEELTVRSDRAYVTLRAATDLQLRVRAYGGPGGRSYLFFGVASLDEGETIDYSLPLNGEAPSLVFSWIDSLDQAGDGNVQGRAAAAPSALRRGEALHPDGRLDHLDAGRDVRRRRLQLRGIRRGAVRHRDVQRAPRPDGQGAAGREGDSHHRDGERYGRRRAYERGAYPERRHPILRGHHG